MRVACYLGIYLLAGLPVLRDAWKELRRGEVFNEFLLMTVATMGAWMIGEYPEAVSVMLLYRIGEGLQERAVGRANRDIAALVDLRPDRARVLKADGEWTDCAPEQVEIGTEIEVERGARVPLDGRLLSIHADFDTAALTGESEPRRFGKNDEVPAGMINLGETVRLRTVRPAADSALSRIMHLVQQAEARKAPTELFIRRFARRYTPMVLLLAALIAILPPLLMPEASFTDYLHRACTFLVLSCPCALVISIPLSYYSGIGLASRMGILFKGGYALDSIADTDTVVFDKTGTLTEGTSLRPDAATAVEQLRAIRVQRIEILSGDRSDIVEQVAQTVGADAWQAGLLPEDKVQRVEALRAEGRRVAFIGDGINDAPVLATADVGLAMGGIGMDAAVETADIVLQTDHPSHVATAIRIGRKTRRIVWLNVSLALGVKLLVLLLGAFGLANMWLAIFADTGVALWCVGNVLLLMRPGAGNQLEK